MQDGKLGILVGGGPAPGINSVIGAATIRARLQGVEVLGIHDGFERLMQGDVTRVRPLSIDEVSRIHFRGGSIIGTSRANPARSEQELDTVIATLGKLGVTHLITIGGDGTAGCAVAVEGRAKGKLSVVHVPKTIDNDLNLPADVDTFGFQTARHVGAELVKNLMVDAFTTSRWYFIITMGRRAGHLALGIGKAAGATLTLIPEEFDDRVPMRRVVDTLVGAIVKRRAGGQRHGVAVIAEGVVLSIEESELRQYAAIERDEHGRVRVADVNLGDILETATRKALAELGIKTALAAKEIGYELRCADPVPYDMEYTRDLGYCAAQYILTGGNAAMVSMQEGRFVPIPFSTLLDPATGLTRVRLVDIDATRYGIARRYMIRLRREDFADHAEVAKLAAATTLSPEEFRRRFEPLTANEPNHRL
jgi:6-phosphofructokinase 1